MTGARRKRGYIQATDAKGRKWLFPMYTYRDIDAWDIDFYDAPETMDTDELDDDLEVTN